VGPHESTYVIATTSTTVAQNATPGFLQLSVTAGFYRHIGHREKASRRCSGQRGNSGHVHQDPLVAAADVTLAASEAP
jgi:hypothetical protein